MSAYREYGSSGSGAAGQRMTLMLVAVSNICRLLMEFAEREIERREQAPESIVEQMRASWEARTPKRAN